MGYTSTVKFALRKDTYLKCQVLQNLPSPLSELIPVPFENFLYWHISSWKWYESYPEIQSMERWFEWLSDEDENPPETDDNGIDQAAFGGVRVGEDYDDVETWGSPGDFDLYISTTISSPV